MELTGTWLLTDASTEPRLESIAWTSRGNEFAIEGTLWHDFELFFLGFFFFFMDLKSQDRLVEPALRAKSVSEGRTVLHYMAYLGIVWTSCIFWKHKR